MLEQKRIRKNKPKRQKKDRKSANGGKSGMLSVFLYTGVILFMSLLFILGYDIITQGRMFAAKEIVVIGNHQLSREKVLKLAGIAPGVNIFAVNLGVARKRLLSDGWVAEARVGRDIPDRLVVRIREHEPLALLDLGEKYIMSREGTVIKRWEKTDPFKLPLVTGLTYSDLPLQGGTWNESFASLMRVLKVAGTEEGALSLARLERIDVDQGLGITLYASGPVKSARIGFENYDEKFKRVDRLLASLGRSPSDPAMEIMELESDNRIVAGPF